MRHLRPSAIAAKLLLVKSGFYHAGRARISTQRLLLHKDIAAAFTQPFVAQLRVDDRAQKEAEVGPPIHPAEDDRTMNWTDGAGAAGAKPATGGRRRSPRMLQPTVPFDPPVEARVSSREVFGPLSRLYRYSDVDVALRAGEWLDASAVMINDPTTFRTDWMPFAGKRDAGYGVSAEFLTACAT